MESLKVIPNIDTAREGGGGSGHIRDQEMADRALKLREVEVIGVPHGTANGEPAIMLVGIVEGAPAPIIFETTLALLESAVRAVQGGCSR